MSKITRVGVDLAKNVIQVHAVDAAGRVLVRRALKRDMFIDWCVQLPSGCLIAMEACSGAHHWCRKLKALGFDARMIPAQFVAPFRAYRALEGRHAHAAGVDLTATAVHLHALDLAPGDLPAEQPGEIVDTPGFIHD